MITQVKEALPRYVLLNFPSVGKPSLNHTLMREATATSDPVSLEARLCHKALGEKFTTDALRIVLTKMNRVSGRMSPKQPPIVRLVAALTRAHIYRTL